jgi:hypothetical protein
MESNPWLLGLAHLYRQMALIHLFGDPFVNECRADSLIGWILPQQRGVTNTYCCRAYAA